jgi:RNA polymerase sigma-70 factor (ECF subfamily)
MIGDSERFTEIYRRHFDEIRRFIARRIVGGDPADLAQEVFVRALCSEGGEIRQPRSFLYQIASNLTLDHLRQGRRRGPHLPFEESGASDAPDPMDPEAIVSAQQRLAVLQRAIEELPPRCREAFTLYKFGHRSHAEIAAELCISVNMVEKHVIKALAHCRRRLSESE